MPTKHRHLKQFHSLFEVQTQALLVLEQLQLLALVRVILCHLRQSCVAGQEKQTGNTDPRLLGVWGI